MEPTTATRVRREAAGLFLLAVVGVALAVLLGWGRMGRQAPVRPPGVDSGREAFLPPAGGRWPVNLNAPAPNYLMALFLSAFESARDGQPLPDMTDAPLQCIQAVDAPVVVTAYFDERRRVRVHVREKDVALSVLTAAAQVAGRTPRRWDASALRVRIDVITEALPLAPATRTAFALAPPDEAYGVAMAVGEDLTIMAPGDAAELERYEKSLHLQMLVTMCRKADRDDGLWRSERVPVWCLRAEGFVNYGAGSRRAVASPRGLTPTGEPTVPRLMRACTLASEYLARSQRPDGSFPPLFRFTELADGGYGCVGLRAQTAAASSLGLMCASPLKSEEFLAACHRAVALPMDYTAVDPADERLKFSKGQDACQVVLQLEASADTLAALCRFSGAGGPEDLRGEIEGLANFLVFMQRDDGLFELEYGPEDRLRSTPRELAGQVEPQAKAALALCLAHAEVGHPGYLLAARHALDALHASAGEAYTHGQARWLVSAMLEYRQAALGALPADVEWAGLIAGYRRAQQFQPGDVATGDMVGGTADGYPPGAGPTADDLVVFASACMMDEELRARNLPAAERAAAFLMHLQYLPGNSYSLPDREVALGGMREQAGNRLVRLGTVAAALEGFLKLSRLTFGGHEGT